MTEQTDTAALLALLDELDGLYQAGTKGEWEHNKANPYRRGYAPFDEFGARIYVTLPGRLTGTIVEGGKQDEQGGAVGVLTNEDAELITALHNAYPALSAALREALERVAEWERDYRAVITEDCDSRATAEQHCTCVPHLRRRIAELEAQRDGDAAYWRARAEKAEAGWRNCIDLHCEAEARATAAEADAKVGRRYVAALIEALSAEAFCELVDAGKLDGVRGWLEGGEE